MDHSPNLPFSWRPALDGLRGIAIVSVVLFHFKTKPLLPGGAFGVDLFFALSGFLITTLLVEEWLTHRHIALRRFYVRRFLRLYPALLAFIAISAAIRIVFADADFTRHPSPAGTYLVAFYVLTYAYSWLIAFDHVTILNYGHLWSLSIEEQYYVVWPALLLVMLRLRWPISRIVVATAAMTALSASVPFMLGDVSWHRLYYGADYRAHELLIGSIAGLLFAGGLVQRRHLRHPAAVAGAFAAAAFVAWLMAFGSERYAGMYRLGFPALAAASAYCLLACAFLDGGALVRLLANPLLAYLGRRSYAIYLWHLAIGQWFDALGAFEQLLVAGAVTLVAAELSYRIVERPALTLKRRFAASDAPSPPAVARIGPHPDPSAEQVAA
jgi:peptidoglycan/LPS O-acetylase OafA/YrhL